MGCIQQNKKDVISTSYRGEHTNIFGDSLVEVNYPTNCFGAKIQEKYKMIKEIGKGSFGCVYLVEQFPSKILRAMKILNKNNSIHDENRKTFVERIQALMGFDHPNIIKVFEYYIDTENCYIISEYINGGELRKSLVNEVYFSESKAKYIMKQLLSAVNYLHIKGIIHRDLKLDNILIEKENEEDSSKYYNIKLIDFGSSCKILKNGYYSSKVGSPFYIAPEVLMKHYNEKCDIWSAGVILYYLLFGYPPFNGDTKEELFAKIKMGHYSTNSLNWRTISKEANDLLSKMLNYCPNERLSAFDCLKHPWLRDVYKSKKEDICKTILIRLSNYTECEQFKQIALAYIIYCINSNNQFDDLKIVFTELDQDSDGLLSYDDIINSYKKYFGSHYIQSNRLVDILSSVDSNGDKYITYEEFLFLTVNRQFILTEANIRIAFDYFDQDNDGAISKDDLHKLFPNNKNQIDNWLGKEGNITLSFNDFFHRMKASN